MKRVLTAVVLIPVVLLVVLRAPVALLAALVAAVAVLSVRELLEMSRNYGVEPMRWPTYVYVVLLFAAVALAGMPKPIVGTAWVLFITGAMAVFAAFVFLVIGMRRRDLGLAFPAVAASTVAFAWIASPLALLVAVREQWAGAFFILYTLVVVWLGDTAAYYAGRAFGRHKLAPRISPGKTWEGTVASFVVAVTVGELLLANAYAISAALVRIGLAARADAYLAIDPIPMSTGILLSAAINVSAQFGDLAESLVKRGAGVKDSGTLLPGHGGMLDRIDALLFAAPVLWCYFVLRMFVNA